MKAFHKFKEHSPINAHRNKNPKESKVERYAPERGNSRTIQGNVQIASDEDLLALDLVIGQILDGLLAAGHGEF